MARRRCDRLHIASKIGIMMRLEPSTRSQSARGRSPATTLAAASSPDWAAPAIPALRRNGTSVESVAYRLAAETVVPALDKADGGRREVHRAAQGVGVAIAFEKGATSS